MEFEELGLIKEIIQAVSYDTPTVIQENAIPHILAGKDVIAHSATGSGKTFAFASGIIQSLEKGKGVQALILVPTRELAQQVSKEFKLMTRYKHLSHAAVYGGVSINPQMDEIRHADIVIGTPGRIIDHLERETLDLRKIKILVLDEADRMLDMGFIEPVEYIMQQCPKNKQTMLFSATFSREIRKLAETYMKDPVKVEGEEQVDPSLLKQVYYETRDDQKFSLLMHLLKQETKGLVMIFCNTQRMTDTVTKNIRKQGIDAIGIHGGLSMAKRTSTMNQFHSQRVAVLVCTDVASRGLDIKGVEHVYNYDIPLDPKEYIHRIGRTARAGNSGIAVSILSPRDHSNFRAVLQQIGYDIQREEAHDVEKIYIEREDSGRGFNRGRSGGRNGESRGARPGYGRGNSDSGGEGGQGRSGGFGRKRPGFSRR
jgi:ATP-dependent RNA helicase DeaD